MPFTRRSGKNRTGSAGSRKRHYGKDPSQGLGDGLPGLALGCEVRGARSTEHPVASAARAGGGRWKWSPESTFETVIQEQTESLYLTSPSGEMFTHPFFLLATCFTVKPSPVAPEIPMEGWGSVEVWMSPDASRQFASPYAYGPNPNGSIDLDGNDQLYLGEGHTKGTIGFEICDDGHPNSIEYIGNNGKTIANVDFSKMIQEYAPDAVGLNLNFEFTAVVGAQYGVDAMIYPGSDSKGLYVYPHYGLSGGASASLGAGLIIGDYTLPINGPISNLWLGTFHSINIGVGSASIAPFWGSGWRGVVLGGGAAGGIPVTPKLSLGLSYSYNFYPRVYEFHPVNWIQRKVH
jgi:hypothetical protein